MKNHMKLLKNFLGIVMGGRDEETGKIFHFFYLLGELQSVTHFSCEKNLYKKANIFLIDTKIRISRKKIYTREIFSKYANFVVQKEKFHQQSCYLSKICHIKTPKNSVRRFA